MRNTNLKYASLYSGCGGFDLGFIEHGFQGCGAYDCDSDAVENFKKNVPCPIFQADLTKGVPNKEYLLDIDVLIAGPPCQGFSTAGKRLVNDKRNQLLSLTGYLAREINPKVLVVENVAGALSGLHARYWDDLVKTMRNAGYRTNTAYFQTADLGMAQIRKRVLLFAWRTQEEIKFPTFHKRPGNLREVLVKIDNQQNHNPQYLQPHSREWLIAKRIKPGQKLSNVRGGSNAVATWDIPEVFGSISKKERTVLELLRRLRRQERKRDLGDADPVSYSRLEAALGTEFRNIVESLLAKGYVRKIGGDIDLAGTFNGKFRRLSWDKPSYTVDTRFGSPRYFLHPTQQRGLSVREAARIQGFKDSYIFAGAEQSQYRLVGNAVPPPLGAFAAEIALNLLGQAA